MNGRGRKRREDHAVKAEINVTSLVDVAFTLLVIFIIIAPALQGGVEVEVPEAAVTPLTADEDAFYVTVDRENRVYLAGTEVPLEAIESSLPQLMRAAGTRPPGHRHRGPDGREHLRARGRTPPEPELRGLKPMFVWGSGPAP